MQINFAHIRHQGINFAVFEADARVGTDGERTRLLGELTYEARRLGLRVEKSALAFVESGRLQFWGTPDLVRFLANTGLPGWTHVMTV